MPAPGEAALAVVLPLDSAATRVPATAREPVAVDSAVVAVAAVIGVVVAVEVVAAASRAVRPTPLPPQLHLVTSLRLPVVMPSKYH